ncbi:MAG: PqiC family protein [Halieaceae bacterium]
MNAFRQILLLGVLTTLVACGSTPRSDYYMLSADARGAPGSGGPSIGVGPITIPDYLKAREMVLNRSAHKLKLADFDRWAEPLDSGIRRVLAVNLTALLNTQSVQIYPWRRDSVPEFSVRLAVVQLSVQNSEARFVGEWSIHQPRGGESISQHITQLSTPMRDSDPESVAAAYSNLLLQLSEKIADTLAEYRAGKAPTAD